MAKEHFTTEIVQSPSGFSYTIYDNIKDTSILLDEHIGKRVMVAGYKTTTKFHLLECHKQGDQYHPHSDAYTLRDKTGRTRCFDAAACRLHPAEYRKGKRWQR